MAKNVDDFLNDEHIQKTLADMLRRIDAVIGDTRLILGGDVPIDLWRIFQFGALDQAIRSADIAEEEIDYIINNLVSSVNPRPPKKCSHQDIKLVVH